MPQRYSFLKVIFGRLSIQDHYCFLMLFT